MDGACIKKVFESEGVENEVEHKRFMSKTCRV